MGLLPLGTVLTWQRASAPRNLRADGPRAEAADRTAFVQEAALSLKATEPLQLHCFVAAGMVKKAASEHRNKKLL